MYFFDDIRVDYINIIMRNNIDFIKLNLEKECTYFITQFWKKTLNLICKAWGRELNKCIFFTFTSQGYETRLYLL